LREVPSTAREFDVSLPVAASAYGLDELLVTRLLAEGLPHHASPQGPLLDSSDLHYLSLRLGCESEFLTAMRRWVSALERLDRAGDLSARLKYFVYGGSFDGPAELFLRVPGGERARVVARPHAVVFEAEWRVSSSRSWADERTWPVLRDVARLDFFLLPAPLSRDIGFSARTGLCDCQLAADIVARRCCERGLQARVVHGILLSQPVSVPHTWAEILTDGDWVPVDPLLVSALRRFAGLDARRWAPERPLGVLVALGTEPGLLADAYPGAEITLLTEFSESS
jgi:hypothetical protein